MEVNIENRCNMCNAKFKLVGETASGTKLYKCKCNRLIELR